MVIGIEKFRGTWDSIQTKGANPKKARPKKKDNFTIE